MQLYICTYVCNFIGEVDIDELLNIQGFSAEKMKDLMDITTDSDYCKPISIKRLNSGKIKKGASKSNSNRIQTCSIVLEESLDFHLINEWLVELLKTKGQDIYRLKGI